MNSRRSIGLFALCLAAFAGLGPASALDYPARPVRWVVGYPPGGATDIMARLIGHRLSEKLGQQFVIENKPGAGNNIGTEQVINSPPDGYTVLLVNPANAINASLYAKLSFNFIRDIAPVAAIASVPMVLIVHPSVPVTTVPGLLTHVKANPGAINMASPGIGTTPHLAGELFKMMSGVSVQHVPYRGAAPAMTDLLAGHVQLYFSTTPVSIEHIRSGRVRGLAVTTSERLEALPDLPSIGEFVPNFEASAWYGVGAPRETPASIVEKLNREINAVLAAPAMKAKFDDLGCVLIARPPAAFSKLIAEETEKWGKVIRFAGMKAE